MIVKGKAIYHAATGRFNTAGSMKLKSFYVVAQSAKNILRGAVFSGGRGDRQLRGKDISLLIKAFHGSLLSPDSFVHRAGYYAPVPNNDISTTVII